ncbi:hypothetical protein [Paraburkholderia fungorum]
MKFGRPLARFDIKAAPGLRLKAQLTTLLVAGCITEMCALVLSILAGLTVGDMSPTAFGLFGGATVLLAHRWVLVDVREAFDKAVAQHHVVLEGSPPHIVQIARTFPGRWLAMLYVQLHPELIDEG